MAVLDTGRGAFQGRRAAGVAGVARFAGWYRAQARSMLPARLAQWLMDAGQPGLIVSLAEPRFAGTAEPRFAGTAEPGLAGAAETITLTPLRGKRRLKPHVLAAAAAPGAAPSAVRAMVGAVKDRDGDVFLEVPRAMCLARTFDIPREAVPRLSALLDAEVARRTPFAAGDVVHGASLSPVAGAPAKLTVRHAIVRRDLADAEARRADLTLADFDGLMVENLAGGAAVNMRVKPLRLRSRWPEWLAALLACAGAAILASGVLATLQALEAEQARLNAALTLATAKADAVRHLVDGASAESQLLASLRMAKSDRPQLIDIIEELSRVLPEGTWVSELRLGEEKPGEPVLSITGYSDRATALVGVLERSQMFTGTALASAITPDPVEGRDRFQLQTRLAKAGAVRGKP